MDDEDALNLKTSIIWVNNYDEIPSLINDIYYFSFKKIPEDYLFFRSNDDPAEIFKYGYPDEYRRIASESNSKEEFREKIRQIGDNFPDKVWKQFYRYYKMRD